MQDTIGIDISKDTLDIHRQSDGRHARFGNHRAGLAALRRWIGKTPVRVVYEATGRYHRDMEAALDAAGHALVKVNPGRARRFAQAAGYGAKTDRVDAAMLARMGAVLELEATPVRSEAMHEIRELHIARLLAEDPALAHRFGILLSIPGIGPVAAIAMLVEMPELGTMDGKEAASLAGLAPITRESGRWKGQSRIGGGRRGLRRALYMPALVATRHNRQLGQTYQALCSAGKPAKVALTAVMRKLLILANALIRDDRKWAETAP